MKRVLLLITVTLFTITTKSQSYPEMIVVEGGKFIMGDTKKDGEANEQPTHQVILNSFKIAKTETTVAQYRDYCNDTGKAMPEAPIWGWIDNYPMVNVTWEDAVSYADWLSKKTGKNYRLPTEAEWEFAARGGNKSLKYKFAGANNVEVVGWFSRNSNNKAHAVAQKLPNELGLYDMSGNVWEWCNDWQSNYVAKAQKNPRGPANGSYRVLRGGSWCLLPSYSSVSYRYSSAPEYRTDLYGFRVVLSE